MGPCPQCHTCIEVLTPSPSDVNIFGDRVFEVVTGVKTRLDRWALVQYDWCPYRRRLGHRCENKKERSREDPVRAKERAPRRNQPYWQPDLRLLPSRTVRGKVLLWHFVRAAQQTLQGGWPVCCRIFSSIPGLYPLILVPIPQIQSWQPSISTHCPMSLGSKCVLPSPLRKLFRTAAVTSALPVLSMLPATSLRRQLNITRVNSLARLRVLALTAPLQTHFAENSVVIISSLIYSRLCTF